MAEHSGLHDHIWTRDHIYLGHGHVQAEWRTRLAVYLNAGFMAVEIAAGLVFGSMALLADGVHMATHVGALGLASFAYWMARRHARNRRFSFGSGKFGDLAAFTSALILGLGAVAIAVESLLRFASPVVIRYDEAIIVAALGLAANLVTALVLREGGGHAHGDDASHRRDLNLRAAYLHVLADIATSVLALCALVSGLLFGWAVLDPAAGLLGAVIIGRWSVQLARQSAHVLLDVEDDPALVEDIRETVEAETGAHVADIHLWRLGPGHRGLIVSLVSPAGCSPDEVKDHLRRRYGGLSHVTIEVAVCPECRS